jgi:hypothetical protein
MIIEYLNNNLLSEKIQGLGVSQIGEVVEIQRTGTDLEKVRNLNKDSRILTAVPSVEFDARKISRERTDIDEDLKARLPCIAWLVFGEGLEERCHAVVITEVNSLADEVSYVDPYDGFTSESLMAFARKWQRADRWLVRVVFGRRETRVIEEYPQA